MRAELRREVEELKKEIVATTPQDAKEAVRADKTAEEDKQEKATDLTRRLRKAESDLAEARKEEDADLQRCLEAKIQRIRGQLKECKPVVSRLRAAQDRQKKPSNQSSRSAG